MQDEPRPDAHETPTTFASAGEVPGSPIFFFTVARLVFEPYESLASLAGRLAGSPSSVTRLRYVLDGEPSARRQDLVAAALRAGAERTCERTSTFAPVVVGRAGEGLSTVVPRALRFLGLDPTNAPEPFATFCRAAEEDDDERSLRGELLVLPVRLPDMSYLLFFDDGAREILRVGVEDVANRAEATAPLGPDELERLARVLDGSGRRREIPHDSAHLALHARADAGKVDRCAAT
ncbi:MAG: hypothetical protein U0183_21420 [Polyangiaceae bacterium]